MSTVAGWAAGATAIIGLLALVWRKAIRPVIWRLFVEPLRRLDFLWRDWVGEPARDGVPARAGVMRRLLDHDDILREHGDLLRDIRGQLYPNGGGSLRDDVRGLRADLQAAGLVPAVAPAPRGRVYASTGARGRHAAHDDDAT